MSQLRSILILLLIIPVFAGISRSNGSSRTTSVSRSQAHVYPSSTNNLQTRSKPRLSGTNGSPSFNNRQTVGTLPPPSLPIKQQAHTYTKPSSISHSNDSPLVSKPQIQHTYPTPTSQFGNSAVHSSLSGVPDSLQHDRQQIVAQQQPAQQIHVYPGSPSLSGSGGSHSGTLGVNAGSRVNVNQQTLSQLQPVPQAHVHPGSTSISGNSGSLSVVNGSPLNNTPQPVPQRQPIQQTHLYPGSTSLSGNSGSHSSLSGINGSSQRVIPQTVIQQQLVPQTHVYSGSTSISGNSGSLSVVNGLPLSNTPQTVPQRQPIQQTHVYPGSTSLSGNSGSQSSLTGVNQPIMIQPQPVKSHSYPRPNVNSAHSGSYHGTHLTVNNVHYGKQAHTYPSSPGHQAYSTSHKTVNHYHYHYNPPQQLTYGTTHYPVYHGTPPVFVHQYRNSGSKFDTLLTGLALYNLGKMSERYGSYRDYKRIPGETCMFEIRRDGGNYERTRIDCNLMSSFIWDEQKTSSVTNTVTSINTSTTNVNGTVTSTTVQNTSVVDALQEKGPSIQVTPGMRCFVIQTSGSYSELRKSVNCGLLHTYSRNSFRNSSHRNLSVMTTILISFLVYFIH